jgi:hypothetical protein
VRQHVELHQTEQLVDAIGDLLRARTLAPRAHAHPERDVLEDRHVAEERVVLEDEAHVAAARALRSGVLVVDEYRSLVGLLEAGDDPQQRRLARTRRPEQREELPVGHGQADLADRVEPAERFGDGADFDAHACTSTARAPSSMAWRVRRSTIVWTTSVTTARIASSDATANDAW